jgi:DNA-binding SARP family transcriptional activator
MHFMVLGPLQITENGGPIVLGGHQRSLLALLMVDVGRSVPVDRIVSEIWPDDPVETVRDSLYTYVSQLRRALGKDRIVRSDGGYRLELFDTDKIDAVAFESAVKRARRLLGSNPETAGHLLDSGLGLWRGRPYEGFEDLASLVPEAARLEELQLNAEEDRIEAELRAGGTPTAGGVEDLCERHPYRERLWGLLARTL